MLANTLIMDGHNIFCNIVFVGKNKNIQSKISKYISIHKIFCWCLNSKWNLLLKVLVKDITEIRVFIENLINIFDKNFNLPKLWNS